MYYGFTCVYFGGLRREPTNHQDQLLGCELLQERQKCVVTPRGCTSDQRQSSHVLLCSLTDSQCVEKRESAFKGFRCCHGSDDTRTDASWMQLCVNEATLCVASSHLSNKLGRGTASAAGRDRRKTERPTFLSEMKKWPFRGAAITCSI